VDPSATRSGSGTRRRPFLTLGDALASEPRAGSVVALAAGRYREGVVVSSRLALVGVCVEGVVIEAPPLADVTATVAFAAPAGAALANLTVQGAHRGVLGVDSAIEVRSVLVSEPVSLGLAAVGGSLVAEDVVVRGVTPAAGAVSCVAFALHDAEEARLGRVVAIDPRGTGFSVFRGEEAVRPATVEIEDAAMLGLSPDAEGGSRFGLIAAGDADLTVRRLLVERAGLVGVFVGSDDGAPVPSRAVLEDVVVRAAAPPTADETASGLTVESGARVEARRVLLEDSPTKGVYVSGTDETGEPSRAVLEDLVVRGTHRHAIEVAAALVVENGGSVSVERALLEDNEVSAVLVMSVADRRRSDLSLTDAVVRGTRPAAGDPLAAGVLATAGADLTLRRVRLSDNAHFGLVTTSRAQDPDPTLTATDLEVTGTSTGEDGLWGPGLCGFGGLTWSLERVGVRDNGAHGVYLVNEEGDAGAEATLADATLSDNGYAGLQGLGDVALTVRRALLEDNAVGAIVLSGGRTPLSPPELDGEDVRGLGGTGWDRGRFGVGVIAESGSRLRLSRSAFEGNREAAIYLHLGAHADLVDVALTGVRPAACGELPPGDPDGCVDPDGTSRAGGTGLGVLEGSTASLQGFLIDGCAGVGLFIGELTGVEARDGVVSNNTIGLDIAPEDYDVGGLEAVRFLGNGTDVSRAGLAPPDPSEAIRRVELPSG